jgi:hypothetical protein
MRASIRHGDDPTKTISTADVIALEPAKLLVPIREPISVEQSIVLGFRQEMLTIGPGSVAVGAGLGTDFIQLDWGEGDDGHRAVIRGSEVLKAWVATFDPNEAARFPEEIR